jgi:hypothetical protein
MNVVGLLYDKMTDNVEIQVLRDLMILMGDYPALLVNDGPGKMDPSMLAELGISSTDEDPQLIINYKVGSRFLPVDNNVDVVERDLNPINDSPQLDGHGRPGFYLRPQGRDGANLTELYLNRSHPRGHGITDPLAILLWS